MQKQRILIIGAGPCGLSSLIAFKTANVSETHEVVCYEKQGSMGGLWN
jgi:cation diffusion facilitator CzcD-associated flavoprotein CzcO